MTSKPFYIIADRFYKIPDRKGYALSHKLLQVQCWGYLKYVTVSCIV